MKLTHRPHLQRLTLLTGVTGFLVLATITIDASQQRAVPRGSQGSSPSGSSSSGSGTSSSGSSSSGSGQASSPQGARTPSGGSGSGRSAASGSGSGRSSASDSGTTASGATSAGGGRQREGQYITGTAINRPPQDTTIVTYYPVGYYPWGYGGFGFGGYYGYGDFYDPYFYGYPSYGRSYSVGYEGSLHLKVKPNHGLVYVDGYFAGEVDEFDGIFQRLHVEAGPHRIEIRADGYEPLMFDVRILPNRTVTYEGELKKQ